MTQGHSESYLWEKALDQYRKELKNSDDYEGIMGVDSMEELLSQTRSLEPPGAQSKTFLTSLNRLEPMLLHLNDFSAVTALFFGVNPKGAALVWGSLRIILSLAIPGGGEMLRDVLSMLEELSMSLPRFRAYEKTLPMNEGLESALVAAYTEMTCFCARTINFFRNNPQYVLQRKSWAKFDGDFQETIKRLKRWSQLVDNEADAARMRADGERNAEILAVMQTLHTTRINEDVLPCYCIPFGIADRFYGRDDALKCLQNNLHPKNERAGIRSVALYGMGGVGKTQIALQYANTNRNIYDAILWISTDSSIKMAQSFLEAAQRLKLLSDTQESQDSAAAISKVKDWLMRTSCQWLLIFDNADDLNILKYVWPGNGNGSILVTSRDFSAAFSPATAGFHVQPFDNIAGAATLLTLMDKDGTSLENQNSAKEITRTLGGLPLALNQISGFIIQQRLALKDFLPLYERNAAKINTRKSTLSDYEHSLSTVWHMALIRLSGDAANLQKLVAFLDPDKVHESILTDSSGDESFAEFAFLQDEMDFLDAKEILLKAALIERSDDATISVHRLVQFAVMSQLSAEEKARLCRHVIALLLSGFPNTWESDVGHQYSAWQACERCLPHVNFLVKQVKKWKLELKTPQTFADLVLRCCWYLYEREVYNDALVMIQVALESFVDKKSLAYASAIDLFGLLEMDTANSAAALEKFHIALAIRGSLLGPDDAFIASSLNNIAMAHTELNNLVEAHSYHEKAIEIRLRTNSDRIGNSYSNMSATLLRMDKPNEAEEMLARCPSLKDFNDETFLKSGNPRFSGDMVLLSRIRARQDRLDDAIRLSSKALTFRQSMLGNRLKTCDALYLVAEQLQRRGNIASAMSLLRECVAITETLSEGKGYEARAKYK